MSLRLKMACGALLALPLSRIKCYIKIMVEQELKVTKKSRGRPKGKTGKPETVVVRVPAETIQAVDGWIERQSEPKPTRPEAIKMLVDRSVARNAATQVKRDLQRYQEAKNDAVEWLHASAKSMNDPHAASVLDSAAFSLGSIKGKIRS